MILPAVRAHDLDGFLFGTRIRPDAFVPDPDRPNFSINNPAYTNWIRLDQFLMSWLLSSISEAMIGHVVRCATSHEIWSTLERLFATKSKARSLQLRLLLQNIKKGSSSIDEYILKMRGLADSLLAAGQPISDEELILYILGGLGSDYEAVVVNLTSRQDSISLQEVQFLLQNQEMRLEHLLSTTSVDLSSPSAHLTSANFKKNGCPSQYPRGPTNYRGRGRGMRGGRGNKPVCQVCGKAGHIALKCYHRFDLSFQGDSSSSSTPQANQANQAFVTTNTAVNDGAWYMDSGATNHVTADLSNLALQADYKGKEKLAVGNGSQLSISHIGSSQILTSKALQLNNILHVPEITKNLISISQFTHDNDAVIEFYSTCCFVNDKATRKTLLQGILKDGLYQLDLSKLCSSVSSRSKFFS
ncbi:Zinc finger, CCHC-type, partial [Trema orientale]